MWDVAQLVVLHCLGVFLVLAGPAPSSLAIIGTVIGALLCTGTPAGLVAFFGASIALPENGNPGITLTTVSAIITGAALAVRYRKALLRPHFTIPIRILAVFWAWALLAASFSGDWYLFWDLTKSVIAAGVVASLVAAVRMPLHRFATFLVFGLSSSLTCVIAYFLKTGSFPTVTSAYTSALRFTFVRSDPNASALYLTVIAAGLWGIGTNRNLPRPAATACLALAAAVAALVPLTFSRGGLAELAALVALIAVPGRRVFAQRLVRRTLVAVPLVLVALTAATLINPDADPAAGTRHARRGLLMGR
ncbi:MAG: hypothetical protein ACLQVN_09905 [Bryobacteraceae bacterium]